MPDTNGTKPLSLLEALGAKQYEIEIDGSSHPFYELTGRQVGLLIEQMEKAASAGVSVIDYFDKETNRIEHLLKENNWMKMAVESRHFFYALIAYSLHIEPDQAADLPARIYPSLIQKAYEVNADFFGGLGAMLTGMIDKIPALAEGLNAVENLKLGSQS